MRGSKRSHMRSANSEDALTWNVFRSLRQLPPTLWLEELSRRGLGVRLEASAAELVLDLWVPVAPPPSLLRHQQDEGPTEADVVIESPDWVWFIEAKYRSDISVRTTATPTRDQVLRNLDVGSYYAGRRAFCFSLLVFEGAAGEGLRRLAEYRALGKGLAERLPHRTDRLSNLQGMGALTWADTATILSQAATRAQRDDEAGLARRAVAWLASKHIHASEQEAGS